MIDLTTHPRRTIVAAALAALFAAAALLTISPSPAAAAHYNCHEGEFCLYFNDDANGGYYHYEFSDSNLDDDEYEGADKGETVGDTARYVQNNGEPGPKDDVIVYGLPAYKGADACIRRDTWGPLPRNWWNNIESFRWVMQAGCAKAGIIRLPRG